MSNDELQKAIDDITMSDAGMSAPVTPAMDDSENDQLADEMANALVESDFEAVEPAPIMSGETLMNTEMPEVKEVEVPQMPEVAVKPEEEAVGMEEMGIPAPEMPMPAMMTEPEVAVTSESTKEEPELIEAMPDVEAPIPEPEMEVPVEEPEVVEEVEKMPEEVAPEVVEKVETEPTGDLEEIKKNALRELYPLLKNMNINPEQAYDICKEVAEMGEEKALGEAFEHAKKISDVNKRANALFDIVKMIEKDE